MEDDNKPSQDTKIKFDVVPYTPFPDDICGRCMRPRVVARKMSCGWVINLCHGCMTTDERQRLMESVLHPLVPYTPPKKSQLLVLVYKISDSPTPDINTITPTLAQALLSVGHIGRIIDEP